VRERARAQHAVQERIERAQRLRGVRIDAALLTVARDGLRPGPGIDALCVVGAQGHGAIEPAQAGVEIAIEPVAASQREVGERVGGIQLERTLGRAARQARIDRRVGRVAQERVLEVSE
jgi:hypothetical protein